MEARQFRFTCDERITLIIFNRIIMNRRLIIVIIIAVFAAAVYFFETGEKDQAVTPVEAPNHVKG